MNFPFLRCLLIAIKAVELFFVHGLDSVHNKGQKKKGMLRGPFFSEALKKRILPFLGYLSIYKLFLCSFYIKIIGCYLYFHMLKFLRKNTVKLCGFEK